MAAQEYYQGSIPGAPQNQPTGPPPQPRPVQTSSLQPPYPLFDGPPPPYTPGGDQRPHSQPPPSQRYSQDPSQQGYQPSGFNPQYRPPMPTQQSETYAYPPEKLFPQSRPQQQAEYRPQQYPQRPQPQQYYSAGQNYVPAPAVQQPLPPKSILKNSNQNPEYPANLYRPDPRDNNRYDREYDDRSRSRSRSRERGGGRKHHQQRKKSSGIDAFLGAGGGAIIGDAIFPGLGTLGGALLGGLGGHEYGKNKGKHGERRRRYSDNYDEGRRGRKY